MKKDGIRPHEGAAAFQRILGAGLPQVLVSTKHLEAVIGAAGAAVPAPASAVDREPAASKPQHSRPAVATMYVPPRTETEQMIARVWEELLGIAQVGIHDNFFELGGHSLLAIQLNSRLSDALQLELSIQDIFDAPTVADLAALVKTTKQDASATGDGMEKLLDQIEQLSDEEVRSLLAAGRLNTSET